MISDEIISLNTINNPDDNNVNSTVSTWISSQQENKKFHTEEVITKKIDKNQLLVLSAEKGQLQIVKFFVDKGADYEAFDNEALRISAKKGHMDIVKYLISLGIDCNIILEDWKIKKIRDYDEDVMYYLQTHPTSRYPKSKYGLFINLKKYYKILGLELGSDIKQIKTAYRRLARDWHPDKNIRYRDFAEKVMKKINKAYNIIIEFL